MSRTTKGFFLVIEGIDGSGKTEISRRLVEVLEGAHPGSVKLTFEPHDPSCAGLFIRQVLAKKRNFDPRTLALAFAANRADHLARDIIPFLQADSNRIVVCDRYYLSSLVYQTTDDISIDEVMAMNSRALQPNLTIFLNASDSTCYQRMRERAESKELFEANLRKIREKYRAAIEFLRKRGDTIVEINADGTKGEVLNSILNAMREHGPEWLSAQLLLPMDLSSESPLRVIPINGAPQYTFADLASELFCSLTLEIVPTEQDLKEIKSKVEQEVLALSDIKIAALFVDYLRLFGYRILGEIPWSETKALDLEYVMPLNVIQRGIALFLNKPQSYSLITKKILDINAWELDPELPMLSDFVICLDFSHEQAALRYFERELVIKKSHTSPTTILLTRSHIRDMALAMILAMLADEYLLSMSALPELKQLMNDFVDTWKLHSYWSVAIVAIKEANRAGIAI